MDFDQVPLKPQRVFKEINEFFDADTIFVTAIGLYQIWSGQFQEIQKPYTYFCCGQAGPLGWEVPACLGIKLGKPNAQVVGVVGDYSFQFLLGDLATAVQNNVPYVMVMLNNGYLSLIRQPSKYIYHMDYAVNIGYGDGYGPDFIKIMEGIKLDAPRGPVRMDDMRNPIENVYIKKVEKKKMFGYDKDELWNTVIKTYPKVSQFWTYGKEKFLAQPVYDRDFPPCKFCE